MSWGGTAPCRGGLQMTLALELGQQLLVVGDGIIRVEWFLDLLVKKTC
jgi:hypothetical protein